jgi:hypothetical protein
MVFAELFDEEPCESLAEDRFVVALRRRLGTRKDVSAVTDVWKAIFEASLAALLDLAAATRSMTATVRLWLCVVMVVFSPSESERSTIRLSLSSIRNDSV